ncbi:unnamed protein product [Periconia digitata]|uniref:F-box domain-containing protein n=1 Tax=Periconia digitata TaxID=1303443 RepID=A0A9W4UIH8_9PLEO|nr:unnamed protein product [Periconia digitata]
MLSHDKVHLATMDISALDGGEAMEIDSIEEPQGFLRLPPEVRNLIYYYADETVHYYRRVPNASLIHGPLFDWSETDLINPGHYHRRPRNTFRRFFALTQVCRRTRAEYRPLWLKSTVMTIRPRLVDDLNIFMQAFFPSLTPNLPLPPHTLPGPKKLDIEMYAFLPTSSEPLDLLPLLQLKIASPATSIVLRDVFGYDSDSDSDRWDYRDLDLVAELGRFVGRDVERGVVKEVKWWIEGPVVEEWDEVVDVVRVGRGVGDVVDFFYFRAEGDEEDEEEDYESEFDPGEEMEMG